MDSPRRDSRVRRRPFGVEDDDHDDEATATRSHNLPTAADFQDLQVSTRATTTSSRGVPSRVTASTTAPTSGETAVVRTTSSTTSTTAMGRGGAGGCGGVSEFQFGFPFEPYDVQVSFMQTLVEAIVGGRLGLFESPTGTGKSLSIICGTLHWLTTQTLSKSGLVPLETQISTSASNVLANPETTSSSLTEADELEESVPTETSPASEVSVPDWVLDYKNRMAQEETASRHAEQQAMRDRLRKRLNEIKLSVASGDLHPCKIRRVEGATAAESDSKFSLTDYDSDGGEEPSSGSDSDSDGPTTEGGDDFTFDERKIFYCSRTHTQLSQFVNEVKRTKYASDLQLVCLASRKQLCINTSVNSLGSVNKMNDKCLDLIKSNGCPFYTDAEGQSLFRDHVLAQVQDIEELVSLGKKLLCCPYYGTRMAIKPAQLVVLPYQILFYNQTRDWLGINLNENVVVIDEAHNLADAINSIYSVELNLAQIECAHTQLTQYLDRYQTRLNAKNMVYIKQILYIIAALTTALSSGTQTGIKSINDFIFDLKIDNYNFWKLERYFQRSDIVHKVMGFCDKVIPQTSDVPSTDDDLIGRHRPALGQVENFLLALTNADRDGRILITINAQNKQASSIRFLLLNPEAHFADVIEQSKATILAGGTLQPMSTFKLQLMDKKVLKQITEFSCGHVIPPSNLLLVPLCEGPTGSSFELNFSTRSAPNVMHDLGRALSNLCSIVPDGVVCFFPSYSYLEEVMRYWEHTGVKSQIARKKELFTEPTDSNAVELVLRKYRAAIDTSFPVEGSPNKPRGAVLCAVVGGKMSEGINFSDGMARCVIMVGMPYPNIKDPILAEKMKYIKERSISASIPDASSQFYEDTCMKAVNQSIGRAIRHAQDYAVIILADVRYTRPAVQSKLPHWMQDRILTPKTNIPGMPSRPPKFGESFAAVAQFFRNKKPHQVALEEMRRNKRATHTSTVTKNS